MGLLSMKRNELNHKKAGTKPVRQGLLLTMLLLATPLVAQESEGLLDILRSAQIEESAARPAGAGPRIVATENVLETILEEDDVLELIVVGESVLSMPRAVVARGGAIHHPLLGEVRVVGRTLEEARKMIEDSLREDYLVDPRVSLNILEYAKYEFSVTGEVRTPANYTLPRNRAIDVGQAIILAGGPTRLGSSKALVERTSGGEKKVIRVDLNDRRAKPEMVRHGDKITVGERVF
jgi:polysaccharide biosynthesis/export protein VpsN